MRSLHVLTPLTLFAFVLLAVTPGTSRGALKTKKPVRTMPAYTGNALPQIAFPIGGIGTGSVSLGGRGDLRDWEIFNKPAKGSTMEFTFFAIWAKAGRKPPVARILERELLPPYRSAGSGVPQQLLSGIPRLKEAEFRGEYPFAELRFRDPALPVEASLEAWNPYIPINVDDSAIPVAFFDWKFTNASNDTVKLSLSSSLFNPIGGRYTNVKGESPGLGRNRNEYLDAGEFRGLLLSSPKISRDDPSFGTMALATPWKDLDVQTHWYRGGWWDQCHFFWDDFSADGRIRDVRDTSASPENQSDVGCLVIHATVPPHGSIKIPVLLAWYFPNRENYWNWQPEVHGKIMKNYVAGRFADAWDVARYAVAQRERLESESRMFHDVLFSSTVPQYVLDAVSSQMASLKTNLCILLQDGSFFGFEGLNDAAGCCFMNCTHVWNYEQTLAFLFPRLERSMRETDFLHNTLPNGHMAFRSLLPLGEYWWKFKPCADGQMGAIVRAYRDWRLSGDTEWLRKLWSKITLALEFAWRGPGTPPPGFEWTRDQLRMPWDPDRDGVMEGEQHNTYDIEFYGPNTMTGSIYLAALKAAAIMAEALGEREKAVEYRAIFKSGSARYDSTLWNGHYYIQDMYVLKGLQVPPQLISPVTEECDSLCSCKQTKKEPTLTAKDTIPKYQYGEGCLSDQLLGQYLANVVGLGHVLNPGHVREAMRSIFTYNFRKSMENFANVQRVYALNDEAGLLLCSWPNGDRPALPFVYSDEVWTGIEYQVAAELIYEGWTDEGLKIVKAVRDRYNGARRNPWDEEECGHHYARAMASWAVLLALSGFHYDGVTQTVTFAPTLHASPYQTFWSCGSGWGSYGQQTIGKRFAATVDVRYGTLNLQSLSLNRRITGTEKPAVTVGGAPRKARLEKEGDNCRVVFEAPVTLRRGEVLRVSF